MQYSGFMSIISIYIKKKVVGMASRKIYALCGVIKDDHAFVPGSQKQLQKPSSTRTRYFAHPLSVIFHIPHLAPNLPRIPCVFTLLKRTREESRLGGGLCAAAHERPAACAVAVVIRSENSTRRTSTVQKPRLLLFLLLRLLLVLFRGSPCQALLPPTQPESARGSYSGW